MPEQRIQELEKEIESLKKRIDVLFYSDRYIFTRDLEIADQRNFMFSTVTGTKFGTTTGQKIGFFNKTPVIQQANITNPSGGATQDAEARTAINSILDVLEAFGFTAI